MSKAVGTGNIDTWSAGPALPEARADAASVVSGNTLYVIGGYGPDGEPTTTVFSLTVDNDGAVGEWVPEEALALPEPRAGASAVTVSDGLVLLGGTDGTAATRSVWKSMTNNAGALQAWVPQTPLLEENVSGVAAHIGDVIFVVGGRNKDGAVVATVQQGLVGGENATPEDPNAITALWRASEQTNLPFPRANMSGFTANGVLYVQGGTDGTQPAQRDPVGHPGRRRHHRGVELPAPDRPGRGPRGLVRRRRRARTPSCSAGRPPQAPRPVSPAPTSRPRSRSSSWASSGRRSRRSSCRVRSASRSATSTPPPWARSTSSS